MTATGPKRPVTEFMPTAKVRVGSSDMSSESAQLYRTISRKTAIALLVVVIGLSALAVWLGLGWVQTYSEQMSRLLENDPNRARVKLIHDLKIVAVTTGVILWALAAYLFAYGLKSLKTQSMPPLNSWVFEGQRIRTGADAIFHAKAMIVISAILLVLGVVATTMLWHMPIQ